MSFLNKVAFCNRRDMRRFVPFSAGGTQYGWLTHERAAAVLAFPRVFQIESTGVALNSALTTPAARSKAIADIAPALAATGLFPKTRGELYAVRNHWSDKPAFNIDRALNPGFGLRAYGVHANGIVEKRSGPHLWIGTRAKSLLVEPGKLDNMVAGGQPAGLGLMENLIKECGEEAHITPKLARSARPTGVLSYSFESPQGLRCDTLFCYDLVVPPAFKPRASEEISRFELMPLPKVLKLVAGTHRFKFNVTLVIIDFAIRHGFITPDTEPAYERLVAGLHEHPQPIGG